METNMHSQHEQVRHLCSFGFGISIRLLGEGGKQCITMVTRTSCFSMYTKNHTGQNKISHLEKKYSFLGKNIHKQWKRKGLGTVLCDKRQKWLFSISDSWQFIL